MNKFKRKPKKAQSLYKSKKTVIPGPWTNVETDLKIRFRLRKSTSAVTGKSKTGSYLHEQNLDERGWYEIVFNIISDDISQKVEEHGIDKYIAACEKYLNKQEKYGKLVILRVAVDHSLDYSREIENRFISVYAKTNKRNIEGFSAWRGREYKIL